MITLLKHLHIIAKVENREEGDYFFPCALPSYDKLNPPPTEIRPLLIAWEINNSGTTTLAIPQGLFPLTIVHLLEQKDIVDFCPEGNEYYRYHDAMSLRVYVEKEKYTIDIINHFTHIEICFYGRKEFCPQICELVTKAIKKSSNDLKVGKNHILAFKCPRRNKRCYCIVKEDKSSTRCTQCRSHCKVLQGDDDSYRCWFSDRLSSPEKWLEEGEVELKVTDINMHGAPGAGADELTDSTQGSDSNEENTGITNTVVDEVDKEKIEKWLKEGKVELKVTRINMHGAPGAGKTCSKHLLLNEPPPSSTDSTPIACPAVQATRISIDDKNNKWERVNIEDLYQQLASHLEENLEDKTENDKIPSEVDEALKSEDDDMPAAEDDDKFNGSDESSIEDSTTNESPRNKLDENEQCAEETINYESAEKKPIEIEPIETEVIQNVRNVQQTKKFCTNWVYFIDSGGQPAYRELLPLFTRAAALNVITIDLTKGLDEKCKFQYRIDRQQCLIDTDLKYSNRDIIRSTICSEAMSTSIEIPDVFKPDKPKDKISNESKPDKPSHSHYLILGTRVDDESVTEKKLKETNKSLREYIANDKVIKQNERKGSIIFPVNTLLPAGSKEREEASVELCTAVSNCKVEMTIKLPIRLFAFEIALQLEANKKKRSFLTRDEVIEIGKSLRLDKESESDIDDALQYLHIVTIILYYRDILPNIIFVDPKPILDVLSRLIAITYVDHNELHLIARVPNERNNLMKFGIFRKTLLEKIGAQNIFNDDFQPSHMIDLLKNLHIIAKVENRGEGDYFFPCALPSLPYDKQHSLNDRPTEIRPLLIAWEINNSGTTTLAIPQGLFPLTIVHLLERKGIVDFAPDPDSDSDSGSDSEDEMEFYRYNDAISLSVDIKSDEYTIDIINRYTHIELRLDESSKEFCPQIRELVTDAIKKSSNDLKVGQNHILAFKCPRRNKQSYCIVKEDLSSTKCTQCRSHCKVLQGDDDSYRCWFSDCQSSSPGTKASLEDPPTKKRRLESSASELFKSVSARLGGSISSCLTTVSMNLNARSLISKELHNKMVNGHDTDFEKAPKLVIAIQTTLDAHTDPEKYLNKVCSALKDVGEKQITDIVNELEQSETD